MKKLLLLLGGIVFTNNVFAWVDNDVKTHFPMQNYSQIISDWISPASSNFSSPLVVNEPHAQMQSWQSVQFRGFYRHYYGDQSPWDANYIETIFHQSKADDPQTRDLKSTEILILHDKSNYNYTYDKNSDEYKNPIKKSEMECGYNGFDEKGKSFPDDWIKKIESNINLNQFQNQQYNPANRAIAANNLYARALPTHEIYSLNFKLPGEGKPFDYLQMSVIWAGTPVYILGETLDKQWLLVASPDVNAWVKSNGIVRVSEKLINEWRGKAQQGLVAVTHTKLTVIDQERGAERFNAYVGAVFPLDSKTSAGYTVLIPPSVDNQSSNHAFLSNQNAVLMPLLPTPSHFVSVMSQLINRPYGWGNRKFHNDCSAEMKSLYTPFGIWLPRNSASQVNTNSLFPSTYTLGNLMDYTTLEGKPTTVDQRIQYLKEKGHPFTTLVYIGGHVFMYAGSYRNTRSNAINPVVLTYQNMWGLRPTQEAIKNGDHDRRAVIGKSVLFPLLAQYPEDTRLASLAGKTFFKMIYLDQPMILSSSIRAFLQFNTNTYKADLRALMVPAND